MFILFFSFSPYSPAGAAYAAWRSGLQAVGLMDHDSISGAEEFLNACKILKIGSTVGFEVRVSFKNTPFEGYRLNNPDSKSIAYITVQGIPSHHFDKVRSFLEPLREERNKRNREQVISLNKYLKPLFPLKIDYNKDVYEKSQAANGGTITERHILAAFSEKSYLFTEEERVLLNFLKMF